MTNNYNSVGSIVNLETSNSTKKELSLNGSKKRNWRSFFIVILALFSFVFVEAQSTTNYAFSTATSGSLAVDANGNTIDMTTGTTQLVGALADTTISAVSAIGFNYFFMGNSYSQFTASADGLLGLGGIATSGVVTSGGTSTTPKISACNADLYVSASGKVHYKLVGTAPNRCLIVEWTGMAVTYNTTAANGNSSWQVRLYETSGILEYVYGTMNCTSTTYNPAFAGFSVGTVANSLASITYATNSVSTNATFNTNTLVIGDIPNINSTANGSRRTYVFTPLVGNPSAPITFTTSAVTQSGTTVNWIDNSSIEGYFTVGRSTSVTGPFVIVGSVLSTTSATTGTAYNFVNSALGAGVTYYYEIKANNETLGISGALTGSQTTLPAGNSTAIASGLWSATTTWSSGAVPTATDNVTIPAGFVVTQDATAAAAYSLLVQGDLVYTVATARVLTVGTNVTIDAGASIKSAATGTVTTHSLVIGGNLINNGTLDFSTNINTAAATITFNTAGNANFILGAGSVTNLKNAAGVTLNKGINITNVLTFNPGGTLTVQGANALGFMVLTNGLLKLDGTSTFTNPLFASASYSIPATAGYWQNNVNATIIGLTGSASVTGLFRFTSGIFNIGTATGNSMSFGTNSNIVIEGGTINASSRFGTTAAGTLINYTQTGGIINVNLIGNTSTTLASFDLGTSASSVINFTAGMVNVVLANTAVSGPRDVRGTSLFTPNFTGTGVINFGNANSGTTPLTFYVSGAVPALTISTTSAIHNLSVAAANTQSFGNVTVPTGSTFNLNGFQFILRGTNLINNGTLTGTTTGSSLYFFPGLVAQSYSGTGTCTAGLLSVSVDTAPNTFTVDAASSGLNPLRVNLFSGNVINSNKITIGTGAALATAIQIGSAGSINPGGKFDVSPIWNLGTGVHTLIYAQESVARVSGFEINPTRIVNALSVDNTNGVTITGGDLTTISSLALTNGIVTTGVNTLTIGNSTTVGTLTGGSATAYVNGALSRSIATANTNTTFVTYPIGKSGIYTPISLAPSTTSIALFKAESFGSNTGTADPSIVGLSSTRRFEALPVSGTFTNINVRLSDAGIVSTNIPVQAPSAAGAYLSAFGSTATFAAGPPITTTSTTPVTSANYTGYLSYSNSNSCSGTPAPGSTTASSNGLCLGQTTTLGITTIPVGAGITYQWQSSSDNVTYTSIVSATNNFYVATPTASTWYQCIVTCSTGPSAAGSTPIQITFANNITSTTAGARCGTGTVSLAATGNSGTTLNWYAASTGGASLATGTSFVTPSISATTNYFVSAGVTGSPATATVGTDVTLTSAISQPTAFCNRWTGYTSQTIYTAAELTALGISAGQITSLGFNITTLGDAATNANFTVKIGNTALTAAPTTFVTTGLTSVYGPVTYTHTAAGIQTITFSSPFNWDGASNIIVEVKHDGANLTNNSITYYSTTATAMTVTATSTSATTGTISTQRLNTTFGYIGLCQSPRKQVTATVSTPPVLTLSGNSATICSGTSTSAVTATAGGTSYDSYAWSPTTGVSGDSTLGWTFNPVVTTNYTLTASQSSSPFCATTASITVSVNTAPTAINIAPTSLNSCSGSVSSLVATGGISLVNSYTETADVLPTSLTLSNTSGTGTAVLESAYFQEGTGSVHFNTADVTANVQYALNSNIDLTGSTSAKLTFSHIAAMEGSSSSYDYGYVEYSTDGGTTWVAFAPANYVGSADAAVWGATPTTARFTTKSYADWIAQFTSNTSVPTTGTSLWKTESFNVPAGALSSSQFRFRFRYTTDSSTNFYGWLIDNIKVEKQSPVISWSPTTNLYTDVAGTIPYTGTVASTVYFKSNTAASATTYTASATAANGCAVTKTVSVTVNPTPAVPTFTTTQATCTSAGTATVSNYDATLVYNSTPSGATVGTGGVISGIAGTGYTFTAANANCTSAVSASVTIAVQLIAPATPTFTTTSATCSASGTATVSNYNATFTYNSNPTGATVGAGGVITGTAGTGYTFTAANASCTSVVSASVTIATALNCDIQYANLQYPGSASMNNCGSTTFYAQVYKAGVTEAAGSSTAITAWIATNTVNNDPSTWPSNSWQLATFNVQAGNNDEYQYVVTGLTAGTYYVASRFQYTGGAFYYGGYTATGGGAWGGSNVSAVLTVTNVSSPTGAGTQDACATGTIGDFVVTGSNILWYSTNVSTTVLPTSTPAVLGTTYYASQTISGCTSPNRLAVLASGPCLGVKVFDDINFRYYPNPVTDILNFKYSNDISKVQIINILGQKLITKTINANEGEIDFSTLPAGTYIVKIYADELEKIIKIVKK